MYWSNEGYEYQNEDCRFSKLDSWHFSNGQNSPKLTSTNTTWPFSLIHSSRFDEVTIYLEENDQLVAVLKARNTDNNLRVYIKLTMGEAQWGYDTPNINNHLCYGEWGADWERGTDFKPTINRTLVKRQIPTRLPDDVLISDEWKNFGIDPYLGLIWSRNDLSHNEHLVRINYDNQTSKERACVWLEYTNGHMVGVYDENMLKLEKSRHLRAHLSGTRNGTLVMTSLYRGHAEKQQDGNLSQKYSGRWRSLISNQNSNNLTQYGVFLLNFLILIAVFLVILFIFKRLKRNKARKKDKTTASINRSAQDPSSMNEYNIMSGMMERRLEPQDELKFIQNFGERFENILPTNQFANLNTLVTTYGVIRNPTNNNPGDGDNDEAFGGSEFSSTSEI